MNKENLKIASLGSCMDKVISTYIKTIATNYY